MSHLTKLLSASWSEDSEDISGKLPDNRLVLVEQLVTLGKQRQGEWHTITGLQSLSCDKVLEGLLSSGSGHCS